MKFYFINSPWWLKFIFPKRIWSIKTQEKVVFLTFDDGPIPQITPWVLKLLKQYNAKATFFCIGKNIEENTILFQQILVEGHSVGNHTQNHLNASKYSDKEYIENVLKAEDTIENHQSSYSSDKSLTKNLKLFRPPYGRLSFFKAKKLLKLNFRIIMWDVLSADFDTQVSKEKCFQNCIKYTKKGSIITFHDSLKAEKNLKFALPKILEYYSQKGFQFKSLN